MENCFDNFFSDFVKGLWLTEDFYTFFQNDDISTCCVMTYQNMMSDISTIRYNKNVQEFTVEKCG